MDSVGKCRSLDSLTSFDHLIEENDQEDRPYGLHKPIYQEKGENGTFEDLMEGGSSPKTPESKEEVPKNGDLQRIGENPILNVGKNSDSSKKLHEAILDALGGQKLAPEP